MKSLSLRLRAVFTLSLVLQAFVLAEGVKVTHPDSNPLRDALQPVPETAIFKMEGYYLWDPSLIKVGDTYHLFASRWPVTAERMDGWKKSHVIRATSKISVRSPISFRKWSCLLQNIHGRPRRCTTPRS